VYARASGFREVKMKKSGRSRVWMNKKCTIGTRWFARPRLLSQATETPRVLLATGRYIGEGFDDRRLGTLFLTLPVS